MGLLLSILIASFGMVLTAKRVSSNSGLNILMFMLAEVSYMLCLRFYINLRSINLEHAVVAVIWC